MSEFQPNPQNQRGWLDRAKLAATILGPLTLPAMPGCAEKPAPEPAQTAHTSPLKEVKFGLLPMHDRPASRGAPGEEIVTAELLTRHVKFLASDDNLGRDTGGGKLEGPVTDYIETIFKEAGLKNCGSLSNFRQEFEVRKRAGVLIKKGSTEKFEDAVKTHNLVAVIEGSDPRLKDEYLIVGAHMDHIGVSSSGQDGDKIYNGADDNASGTAAVLAILKGLSEARAQGKGPARSVIVVLFSAEELGLLGSQYFVENPPVPLAKIKGMINFDMIGRLDKEQVSICDVKRDGTPNFFHGLHDSRDLIFKHINHDIDHRLPYSDQYSFYMKDIPMIRFFEGLTKEGQLNPDHHEVTDHIEKLDFDKIRDITRFAYRHVLAAANLPPR
jgi:hypothetical protein